MSKWKFIKDGNYPKVETDVLCRVNIQGKKFYQCLYLSEIYHGRIFWFAKTGQKLDCNDVICWQYIDPPEKEQ